MGTEPHSALVEETESLRRSVSLGLDGVRQEALGQFLTPATTASLMASMLRNTSEDVRLLDPGAGIGSLTAASVVELLSRPTVPRSIEVVAYEIDPSMIDGLHLTLKLCAEHCTSRGVAFRSELVESDFLESVARAATPHFTAAILNPPYFKIAANSEARARTRSFGVDVPNAYAAFIVAAMASLESDGELVAITPRSFCNGTYFRSFRKYLLDSAALDRVHVFDSRSEVFKESSVLQENIVFHLTKSSARPSSVKLTSSSWAGDQLTGDCAVPYAEVIHPDDPERFIHVDPSQDGQRSLAVMQSLPATLSELGLTVSTGPIVDFRAKEHLRATMAMGCVPLIYPTHLVNHGVSWPKADSRKPNAIREDASLMRYFVPDGNYVLVKRFSVKEERRRLVASVLESGKLGSERIGLENHLNYFHEDGGGLPLTLARGLSLYLNSTIADTYFRRFSGHTQVNATDLRNMRYPSRAELIRIGKKVRRGSIVSQARTDALAAEFF